MLLFPRMKRSINVQLYCMKHWLLICAKNCCMLQMLLDPSSLTYIGLGLLGMGLAKARQDLYIKKGSAANDSRAPTALSHYVIQGVSTEIKSPLITNSLVCVPI